MKHGWNDIDVPAGEPFRIIGIFATPYTPYGTVVTPLGEDMTDAETAAGRALTVGYLFVVVQVKERAHPLKIGEFFIEDLWRMQYEQEVKAWHS